MDDMQGVTGDVSGECGAHSATPPLPANSIADRTPASSSTGHVPKAQTTPYSIDVAIADAVKQMTSGPLPEAAPGIQHWIWTGHRLVRASPEAAERLRQQEVLEQAESQLWQERQQAYRQQRRQSYRRLAKRLLSPLRQLLARWEGLRSMRANPGK